MQNRAPKHRRRPREQDPRVPIPLRLRPGVGDAHGQRHTRATGLRGEGFDIGIISKQLGHASIATTARYFDYIAPWAVVDAVRKREWAPLLEHK